MPNDTPTLSAEDRERIDDAATLRQSEATGPLPPSFHTLRALARAVLALEDRMLRSETAEDADDDTMADVTEKLARLEERVGRTIRWTARKLEDPSTFRGSLCARCGHPQDWHRHDDERADDERFRCIGYDCMADGPPPPDGRACDCPDFVDGAEAAPRPSARPTPKRRAVLEHLAEAEQMLDYVLDKLADGETAVGISVQAAKNAIVTADDIVRGKFNDELSEGGEATERSGAQTQVDGAANTGASVEQDADAPVGSVPEGDGEPASGWRETFARRLEAAAGPKGIQHMEMDDGAVLTEADLRQAAHTIRCDGETIRALKETIRSHRETPQPPQDPGQIPGQITPTIVQREHVLDCDDESHAHIPLECCDLSCWCRLAHLKHESGSRAGEPLPCPFCGSAAFVEEMDGGGWVSGCNAGQERKDDDMRCRGSAIGFFGETRAEALAAWNRRVSPPEQPSPEVQEPRELLCMRCDREHPVWTADSNLWNATVRLPDGDDEYPFLCPTCFMAMAVERGVATSFYVQDGDAWLRKMADKEDGHEIGVGGLAVDAGLYVDPSTPSGPQGDERERLACALEAFARVKAGDWGGATADDLRAAARLLRSAPTRSRTLDELCEEEGALGYAMQSIRDRAAADSGLVLYYTQVRALADYLSRPASEEPDRDEWLKQTTARLEDMGLVVVGRTEWTEIIPRMIAASQGAQEPDEARGTWLASEAGRACTDVAIAPDAQGDAGRELRRRAAVAFDAGWFARSALAPQGDQAGWLDAALLEMEKEAARGVLGLDPPYDAGQGIGIQWAINEIRSARHRAPQGDEGAEGPDA